jgi:hypothetical protein
MPWTNAPALLYHGTDEIAANNIILTGIRLSSSRPAADFGSGFYLTSNLHQAEQWANQKVRRMPPPPAGSPVIRATVLMYDFDRDAAADLDDHLTFVLPTSDFFDFVAYNKRGGAYHARLGGVSYDLVYGPLAAFPQTLTYENCDQLCLLTSKAVAAVTRRAGPPALGTPFF